MSASVEMVSPLPQMVVVTGTSSGLGKSIAVNLCKSGCEVIGVDLAPAPQELESQRYLHVQGDVSTLHLWDEVAETINDKSPERIGLVCAAAVLRVGNILDFEESDIDLTMNVNFRGTVLAFKTMIPIMNQVGGGPLVAVASIDATFAEQQLSVYAASKGAVRQLTRTVAMDHAREGIRANVLSPGPMMAGLFERHMQSASDPSRFLATRAARQPGGRVLEPSEIAHAALFLLSDASSGINGAEIIADGGLTTSFDFRTGAEGASV